MRWYRQPAAQFVALGLALFVAKRELGSTLARPVLVITAGRVAQVGADFRRETGRPPGPADEQSRIEQAIEEELLFQEARARGLGGPDAAIKFRLTEKMRFVNDTGGGEDSAIDEALYRQAVELGFDQHDPVVRRIIVQKMRLLLAREADEQKLSEAELQDYYDRHRDRYVQAARVGLWHVFVSAEPRASAAAALLARLRTQSIPPAAAVPLGEPFPMGSHLRAQSMRDLHKVFGADFAQQVLSMEPGAWQGPVPSTQGLHLVWVESRQPERIAPFAAVRSRVRAEYVADQRQTHLAATLRTLREKYIVRVDRPEGAGQG